MIILLDGSKGAGKTTTSEILLKHLENTLYLGLDAERRKLRIGNKTRNELNKEAFEIILLKTKQAVSEDRNLLIDCGVFEERLVLFENIALSMNTELYKFFLKASRDTLLDRVRARDKASNRITNVDRFDYIYELVHAKKFDGFTIFETENMNPEEVAGKILEITT